MFISDGKRNARQEIFCDASISHAVHDLNIRNEARPIVKKVGCSCSKSQCLKMYCECFKNGSICGPECNCQGCKNIVENIESIKRLKEQFRPKDNNARLTKEDVCTCKHSLCSNNYCPCYKTGKGCGPGCQCFSCENINGLKKKPKKSSNTIIIGPGN